MRFGSIIAAVIMLTLWPGCSDQGTSPDSGGVDRGMDSLSGDAAVSTTVIGAAGGTAESPDKKAELTIPAGALPADVTITITAAAKSPPGNVGPAYDIGPDGTKFTKPVTLTIDYDPLKLGGLAEADLRLGTVVKGVWEVLPGSTVDTRKNQVSGQTDHLSLYGVVPKASDAGIPEAAPPDQSIPDKSSQPDQLIPDQSMPPDKAIPDKAVPDKATPDQSLPDAGVAWSWVNLSGGSFTMGSPVTDICRQPIPTSPGGKGLETQHSVTLSHSFSISATETTRGQFKALMGSAPGGSSNCSKDTCPVHSISWGMAASFCNALSVKHGKAKCYNCSGSKCSDAPAYMGSKIYTCPGYRLPTEAEWEYAYRGGSNGAIYKGSLNSSLCKVCSSTQVDPSLDKIAWYCANSGNKPHPVAQKTPNGFGLYDMAGNVAEWCHDGFVTDLGTYAVTDPWGSNAGYIIHRMVRGGSYGSDTWFGASRWLRAGARFGWGQTGYLPVIGFRCVRSN